MKVGGGDVGNVQRRTATLASVVVTRKDVPLANSAQATKRNLSSLVENGVAHCHTHPWTKRLVLFTWIAALVVALNILDLIDFGTAPHTFIYAPLLSSGSQILFDHCSRLQKEGATLKWSRDFRVEERYDLGYIFHSEDPETIATRAGLQTEFGLSWYALSHVKRLHLLKGSHNHSLLSSKVSFYRLMQQTSLPIAPVLLAQQKSDLIAADGSVVDGSKLALSEDQLPFIIKPAHCVAGYGVNVFQEGASVELAKQHARAVLEQRAIDEAPHMWNVQPGVVVQKLFYSSRSLFPRMFAALGYDIPPEQLKIVVLWGNVLVLHARGIPGLQYVVNDGDLSACSTSPLAVNWVISMHAHRLIGVAEALARASGIPNLRVDFFVSSDGRWVINEVEVVSGLDYRSSMDATHNAVGSHIPQPLDECMGDLWSAPFKHRTYKTIARRDEQISADICSAMRDVGY